MENIGKIISELRKKQGLTQQGLSKKINYSDKVISKWERGESLPDINAMNSLSKVFNVSIDELVSKDKGPITTKVEKTTVSKTRTLALLFLQIVLILCAASLFAKILAAVLDINGYTLNGYITRYGATGIIGSVLAGLFVISAILDTIFASLKINRVPTIVSSFSIIALSLILLIVSYFIYGAYSAEVTLNSMIIEYSIGVVIIGMNFLLGKYSNLRKEKNMIKNQQLNAAQEKTNFITKIVNLCLSILLFGMMFVPCYVADITLVSQYNGYSSTIDASTFSSIWDLVKDKNGWYISLFIVFLLIFIFDIILALFYFIDKKNGNQYKHINNKMFKYSSLSTGCLFLLLFIAAQIAFLTSGGESSLFFTTTTVIVSLSWTYIFIIIPAIAFIGLKIFSFFDIKRRNK